MGAHETFDPEIPHSLEPLLEHALAIALRAGEITLRHFGTVLSSEEKGDGTPVTAADRETEELLRREIRGRYPDHAILGEEYGEEAGEAPVRWILDPIDGTRSFMQGVPLYAVLVGVEVREAAAVGVAHFPALGETVAAARGTGCRWWKEGSSEPTAAAVSKVSELSQAGVLTTDPEAILLSPVASGWRALAGRAGFVRGWGDAYGHLLVATGRAEAMIDPVLSAWDAAPLLPILEEAGGRFTDLAGRPTVHGGSGLSTNGAVHAEVSALLNS